MEKAAIFSVCLYIRFYICSLSLSFRQDSEGFPIETKSSVKQRTLIMSIEFDVLYGALNQPLPLSHSSCSWSPFAFNLGVVVRPWNRLPQLFPCYKDQNGMWAFVYLFNWCLFNVGTNIFVFNLWFMAGVSMGFRIFILFCFIFAYSM